MSAEEQNVEETVPAATVGEDEAPGGITEQEKEEGETAGEELGGPRKSLQLCPREMNRKRSHQERTARGKRRKREKEKERE